MEISGTLQGGEIFTLVKVNARDQFASKKSLAIVFRYTAISINVVGSKHKAKRQDRKFTWDFYE